MKSKRDLVINQVPITTNPSLTVVWHKLKLRRVTKSGEGSPYQPEFLRKFLSSFAKLVHRLIMIIK